MAHWRGKTITWYWSAGKCQRARLPAVLCHLNRFVFNVGLPPGWISYFEWNIRLFLFLLFRKMDVICAVDLDTILPCYFISKLKGIKRIYDAHELFTEMKEVISRPWVKKCWLAIERFALPRFEHGYTVSESIAHEFEKRYGVRYEVIRNVPVLENGLFSSTCK